MRCSQCGLPLSPKRGNSNCPRCGTPVNATIANQAQAEGASLPMNTFAPGSPAQFSPINPGNPIAPTAAANMYVPSTPNWNTVNTFQNSASPQIPFSTPQSPQVPFPSSENRQSISSSGPVQQAPFSTSSPIAGFSSSSAPYSSSDLQNRAGQPFPRKPSPSTQSRSRTTRIGFTIAGLCILAGGFLLTFVYFIGQGFLPDGGTAATTAITTKSTITAVASQKPTPTVVPTPSAPAVTPTPVLPGQSLLDTSVLGGGVNQQTGQVIQQSTNFPVNQRIYVVLSLHPGGNSHTVCLNWYLNDQSVNTFSFQVDPNSNYNYYSFATMSTAGNGRVDISLANTTSCADATVARKLSFTVS